MEEKSIQCEFCGKLFSKKGIKGHIWRVHTEVGQQFKPAKNCTHEPWNKGLKKEDDDRILNQSIKSSKTHKLKIKNGNGDGFCSKLFQDYMKTPDYKIEHSNRMKETVKNNPESYDKKNVSGRVKLIKKQFDSIEYIFKGSWEVIVAEFLFENKIKFTNKVTPIPYIWKKSGKEHLYFPDFYLPEYNKYIEVKGFKTLRDIDKWTSLSENMLIVFQKNEIFSIKKRCFDIKRFKDWLIA